MEWTARFAAFLTAACLTVAWVPSAQAADPAPGSRIEIKPADLPEPGATPNRSNRSSPTTRRDDQMPRVPVGFKVSIFADRLDHARWLEVAPNGDVFVAEPKAKHVLLLRDVDGDGKAESRSVFAEGFDYPHGLAVKDDALYIGDRAGVWRVPYNESMQKATTRPQRITAEGAFGSTGGHATRNLAFSPDGKKLYVSIGSAGNIAEEPEPRATIQEFSADGTQQRTFATGLRNAVGIAFYPGTSDLYTVVNERDGLGDGLVPDYFTRVRDGGFYGWPYSYIGSHPQPGFADKKPDLVKKAIVPDVLFESHSAPLGLVFYSGDKFPQKYRGGAFVGLHGSWNAGAPRGYTVAFVPFENGKPAKHYEVFMSGFWVEGDATARVIGRPVGTAVAKDGSLLVADDVANVIWRVSYTGN
ncbi:MAG TPA: sorbosone dehydrogenase family protein [Alphaproteobacteria bacterium]|nr:sorbosone dehydrogenase family protein [Alphaproteobacteria bacterium]